MLIYIDEVISEIQSVLEYANIIQEKFNQGRSSEELLLDTRALDKRIEYIFSIMPDNTDKGNIKRHVSFMLRYLANNQVESCRQDIQDIVNHDLLLLLEEVKNWSNNLQYLDVELKQEVATLIKTNQFDSAIRKAFVVLKSRLCNKFSIDHNIDGVDLINRIFGTSSNCFQDMPRTQKQSYRDLYAGLFGLMRNRYMHNNIEATIMELDMAISSINYCLILIDDFNLELDGE